jgi:O-acetyl-ADP-ribose deacetylase (regulator of RNase III)
LYGYPPEEAARIALGAVKTHLELAETKVQQVVFVLFGKQAYRIYLDTLAGI